MPGTLTVTTISDGSINGSATTVIRGSAKVWSNTNGAGGATVRSSFNLSSVTRNGTGDYTQNFASAVADANYCVFGSTVHTGSGTTAAAAVFSELLSASNTYGAKTTSTTRVNNCDNNGDTYVDSFSLNFGIMAN
jgi:hypothetical protein